MTAQPAPSNHPVFLLAEHLDAILAGIEDLEACKPPMTRADPQRAGSRPRVSLMRYVRELSRHEASAIAHATQARELTRVLVRRDKRFAMLGGLFVGGTAPLDDAVRRMSDETIHHFTSGGDPIGYLRSRGVIDEDAGGLTSGDAPEIGESFRLAGEIEIGPLGELVSTFLNTIELHFDLFPDLMEADDVMAGSGDLVS